MTGENDHQYAQLRLRLDSFLAGEMDLDGIQAAMQSTMTLLERDPSSAADAIHSAEAEVETIRFTRLRVEQRAAVVAVVQDLLAVLPDPVDPREDPEHD